MYYIPQYLVSLAVSVLILKNPIGGGMLGQILSVIAGIFVFDIFGVGFMRSLLTIKSGDAGGYDVNLVLSGYRQNFGNTLKIVFFKRLYLFGWSILIVLPLLVFGGVIGFMADTPEISQLLTMIEGLAESPTLTMVENISVYMAENCMYVVYMLLGVYALMILALIPYIRKNYEYAAIPMILAENGDISRKAAFGRTREIMVGHRMEYFGIQLSFIGLMLGAWIVSAILPTEIGYYIVWSFLLPYVNMTLLGFYSIRCGAVDGVGNEQNLTIENYTNERND